MQTESAVMTSDLFESAFHVDALVPGSSWIGQTVAGVSPPRDVDLLTPEVPERLRHHQYAVVRQRGGELRTGNRKHKISRSTPLGSDG